ncbi:hypothetical protein QQ045_026507 [Rhodiola kirilowii]
MAKKINGPSYEYFVCHSYEARANLDCHLMVTNPLDYVYPLGKAGASGFTFYIEVSKDNWRELVHNIKSKGMRPGVALKPGIQIEEVFPLVEDTNPVAMDLVMTVEPGFGGQKFMPRMMDKVKCACGVLRMKYPTLDIEVDGGLGPSTIEEAATAGANCIVAGSSVLDPPNRLKLYPFCETEWSRDLNLFDPLNTLLLPIHIFV